MALVLPGVGWAQDPVRLSVAFSSTFTEIPRDCHPAVASRAPSNTLESHQETPVPLVCPGPDGQAALVAADAEGTSFYIGPPGLPGPRSRLLVQVSGGRPRAARRLEWRLANGRPFAAILRVSNAQEYEQERPDTSHNPYATRFTQGASLVAVGLPGFEQVDTFMAADRPDAEAEFRRRVDRLYAPVPAPDLR